MKKKNDLKKQKLKRKVQNLTKHMIVNTAQQQILFSFDLNKKDYNFKLFSCN